MKALENYRAVAALAHAQSGLRALFAASCQLIVSSNGMNGDCPTGAGDLIVRAKDTSANNSS